MDQRSFDQLGKLQRAIMEAVWELGEATVRQVRVRIDPQRKMAYTTFLSTMQRLTRLGWLRRYRRGPAHVYKPAQCRWKAWAVSLCAFTERVFKGNQSLLFQTLFETMNLSDEDIAKLQEMIDKHRKRPADV